MKLKKKEKEGTFANLYINSLINSVPNCRVVSLHSSDQTNKFTFINYPLYLHSVLTQVAKSSE